MSGAVRLDDLRHGIQESEVDRLLRGTYHDPHHVLGMHPVTVADVPGSVVRAFDPRATRARLILPDEKNVPMQPIAPGLFAAFVPALPPLTPYRFCFERDDGHTFERGDPYRFLPTVGELDLHLLAEGKHQRLWRALGAHARSVDGVRGTSFAVWAPAAQSVSVMGDFCDWDPLSLPMRSLGASGVYELFVPDVDSGALYKYVIRTPSGETRVKTDPMAQCLEMPPASASRVFRSSHSFRDDAWLYERSKGDLHHSPMTIYEVHLGSWQRDPTDPGRLLDYREIAPRLAAHAKSLGFTHLELLPVAEHAFYGSWGYQITGYYAPTARYGTPDDLREFVEVCHDHGLGVLLDWVPAHFPKDDYSLRLFDGSALYEHEDPRRGEHPDWGTLIFNFGRNEVRSFLISNALYWLHEFHFDGLRVDAVASMLYLDYSRREGEWLPNREGGRENLEAISFLQELNTVIHADLPGTLIIAEESTAWPGVSRPVESGGLGFDFKWNMGWMHDTLEYFCEDPVHRKYHQDRLSFSMLYEYDECFMNPLSHDEVVHGKGSLFQKMPGDRWRKLAQVRALFAYQVTRPGKSLLFMGSEFAPEWEWNHDVGLDWEQARDPDRQALQGYLAELHALYQRRPCFWRHDPEREGFEWIDASDRDNSVYAYVRRSGDEHAVVVLNLTPVPREDYRVGVPINAAYRECLSSDASRYGGSGMGNPGIIVPEPTAWHGRPQSVRLLLPPLAALILEPATLARD